MAVRCFCVANGVDSFDNLFENFDVRLFEVHFLTQENLVEKIFAAVPVCIEPMVQAVLPMKVVGVAQQVNIGSLLKSLDGVQLSFGNADANAVPGECDLFGSRTRIALGGNESAEFIGRKMPELVTVHQVGGFTFIEAEFALGEPECSKAV